MEPEPSYSLPFPTATMSIRDISLPVMLLVCICMCAEINLLKYTSENHICTSVENIQKGSLTSAWDLACRNEI